MENPEKAFVDYASSSNNEVGDDRAYGDTVESEEEVGEELEEEEEEDDLEYFDTFPTIEELGYHKWILKNPRPSWVSAKEITNRNYVQKFFQERKKFFTDARDGVRINLDGVASPAIVKFVFFNP
nr:hypothetical protein [Tanacetum cinerariifolium]